MSFFRLKFSNNIIFKPLIKELNFLQMTEIDKMLMTSKQVLKLSWVW